MTTVPERPQRRGATPADWEALPDDAILQMRIRDFGLDVASSPLQPMVERLYAELDQRGLGFRPSCYLGDEWFCPDKIPIISIPFFLAHPRLKSIELRMMYEVEGGTDEHCMRLLRHECGHAINYAYRLYLRTRWRELFGPFSTTYSTSYYSRPYSRHYVIHLEDNYAQAHPDEDFAETFAVWLTPGADWEHKYARWPVLRKLRYVDNLMQRIARTPPTNTQRSTPYAANRMASTLAAFYRKRKRETVGGEFPGYYDDSLLKLFVAAPADHAGGAAASLLRRHRRHIVNSVTRWTPQRKYDIHQLLQRLIRRCEDLQLCVRGADAETLIEATALICVIVNRAFRAKPGRTLR
jgi:hypothetical protein